MNEPVVIREGAATDEYPRLVEIWRTAVDSTHDFLAEVDRATIEEKLPTDYLPNVRLAVAERAGLAVGFAGTADGDLAMLFTHADQRGSGVGSALLHHVIRSHKVSTVDVNEQNEQAVSFYRHFGFEIVSRSPIDAGGLPYPLLHMKLPETPLP